MNAKPILDKGVERPLTLEIARQLLAEELICDSGKGYYVLAKTVTFELIDEFLQESNVA